MARTLRAREEMLGEGLGAIANITQRTITHTVLPYLHYLYFINIINKIYTQFLYYVHVARIIARVPMMAQPLRRRRNIQKQPFSLLHTYRKKDCIFFKSMYIKVFLIKKHTAFGYTFIHMQNVFWWCIFFTFPEYKQNAV